MQPMVRNTFKMIGLTMLLGQPLSAQTHTTKSSSSPLTWFTQTGTGMAGRFEINNAANGSPALYSTTNGGGGAAGSFYAGGGGYGVIGQSATGIAGFFLSYGNNEAVYGESTSGNGGAFVADKSGYGVYGQSASHIGGYFINTDNHSIGVYGQGGDGGYFVANTGGNGVFGQGGNGGYFVANANGDGVYGQGFNGGYFVAKPGGNGVYGKSSGGASAGVYGIDYDNCGVYGAGEVGIVGVATDNATNMAGAFFGNVNVTGHVKAEEFITTSDARYKTHIATLTHALDKVMALRGVTYDWRADAFPDKRFGKGRQVGFIAQEVEKTLPQIVGKDKNGYRGVDYSKVAPVLVEAMKEQQAQIKEEQTLIKGLQAQIQEQQARNKEQARINTAQHRRITEIEAQVRRVLAAAFSDKSPALGALLVLGAGGSLAFSRRRRLS